MKISAIRRALISVDFHREQSGMRENGWLDFSSDFFFGYPSGISIISVASFMQTIHSSCMKNALGNAGNMCCHIYAPLSYPI